MKLLDLEKETDVATESGAQLAAQDMIFCRAARDVSLHIHGSCTM